VLGAQQVADLGEQLDVGGLGRAGLLAALAPLLEVVEREHDQEVDDRGDDEEVDRRRDHRRDVDVRALLAGHDLDAESGALRRCDRVDERLQDALGERRDDAAERRTDDHGDGQVDDVASQDEVLESFEHASAG
jgi:hypothetical protein